MQRGVRDRREGSALGCQKVPSLVCLTCAESEVDEQNRAQAMAKRPQRIERRSLSKGGRDHLALRSTILTV